MRSSLVGPVSWGCKSDLFINDPLAAAAVVCVCVCVYRLKSNHYLEARSAGVVRPVSSPTWSWVSSFLASSSSPSSSVSSSCLHLLLCFLSSRSLHTLLSQCDVAEGEFFKSLNSIGSPFDCAMICPASRSNSGQNWLDRLRTSKGFPVGNELGLEAFLDANAPPSDHVESSGEDRSGVSTPGIAGGSAKVRVRMKKARASVGREKKEDWVAILSGVLAELFNMGEPRRSRIMDERRKCRKQKNPRMCTILCSANVDDRNAAVSPQNSVSGTKDKETVVLDSVHRRLRRKGTKNGPKADEKEEESANVPAADLSSYSCTEVTVIDSSFPGWKSEKTIFRKGNDWRIREVNVDMGAPDSFFSKKRRLACGKDHDEPPISSWISGVDAVAGAAAQGIRTTE